MLRLPDADYCVLTVSQPNYIGEFANRINDVIFTNLHIIKYPIGWQTNN